MARWDEVDEPVLRWLADQRSSYVEGWQLRLTLRPDPPESEDVPGLDDRQVDDALMRLKHHGLIDGKRQETNALAYWSRLRTTGLGLQVLGEWPELDRLSHVEGLRLLLARIADESDDPETKTALRRLVGFTGSIGDAIVDQVLRDVAAAGAEELQEEL